MVANFSFFLIVDAHAFAQLNCSMYCYVSQIIPLSSSLLLNDRTVLFQTIQYNISQQSLIVPNVAIYCYVLTFDLAPKKCYSKVMHRKEVTHSNGQYSKEIAWTD